MKINIKIGCESVFGKAYKVMYSMEREDYNVREILKEVLNRWYMGDEEFMLKDWEWTSCKSIEEIVDYSLEDSESRKKFRVEGEGHDNEFMISEGVFCAVTI